MSLFTQKASTFSSLIGSSILSAGVVFAAVMPAQASSVLINGYTMEPKQDATDVSKHFQSTNRSKQTNPEALEALIDQLLKTSPDLTLGKDFTVYANSSTWETFTAPPQRRRVPEPTSLLALGLIGGAMFLSRRRQNG